jgi:hypothetical protein
MIKKDFLVFSEKMRNELGLEVSLSGLNEPITDKFLECFLSEAGMASKIVRHNSISLGKRLAKADKMT